MSFIPLEEYLSKRKANRRLNTGIVALDTYTRGGFEESRFYHVYGKTHHGKTLWVLELCKAALRMYDDATVFIFDAENALTVDFVSNIPEEHRSRFFVITCNDIQKIFNTIIDIFKDKKKYPTPVVILDSINALATQENLADEGLEGKMNFSFQKASGVFFRKLNNIEWGGWFFGINQVRKLIPKGFVVKGSDDEFTPGGEAWDFYASMKLQIAKYKAVEKGDAFTLKIRTRKNKCGKEFTCFLGVSQDLTFGTWSGCKELLVEQKILTEQSNGTRFSLGKSPKKYYWKEILPILDTNKEKILNILQKSY